MKKKTIKIILSLIILGLIWFMFLYNKTTEVIITYVFVFIASWQVGTWLGNWTNGEKE